VRGAHSLNFRLEKASLIVLVAVINGAGVLPRLVVLLITPYNEGHRLRARHSVCHLLCTSAASETEKRGHPNGLRDWAITRLRSAKSKK